MFGRKKEKSPEEIRAEENYKKVLMIHEVLCPHCEKKIDHTTGAIDIYMENQDTVLVGCPHCRKVLGATAAL